MIEYSRNSRGGSSNRTAPETTEGTNQLFCLSIYVKERRLGHCRFPVFVELQSQYPRAPLGIIYVVEVCFGAGNEASAL